MSVRNYQYLDIFGTSGKAAAGVGTTMLNAGDFRHLIVELSTTGVGGGEGVTIKCQGTTHDTAETTQVAFGSAASQSNPWAYIQLVNLADGVTVDGASGVVVSGSNIVNQYAINTDGMQQINFELSSITGTLAVFARVMGYND